MSLAETLESLDELIAAFEMINHTLDEAWGVEEHDETVCEVTGTCDHYSYQIYMNW